MTRADMDDVLAAFVRATAMAERCGFDMVELHCAHGYLLSAFITPLMQPAHRRLRRHAREPAALPARSVLGDARGLAASTSPCRCASRRPTGSTDGITRRGCGRDREGVRGGRRRRDRRLGRPDQHAGASRSTAACSRRRSPTGSATRPGSRPWRSATSSSRTTSTASSPPAAPTSAAWRGRTSPTPTGALHAAAQLGYDQIAWPLQYLAGRDQLRAQPEARGRAGGRGMSRAALWPDGMRW